MYRKPKREKVKIVQPLPRGPPLPTGCELNSLIGGRITGNVEPPEPNTLLGAESGVVKMCFGFISLMFTIVVLGSRIQELQLTASDNMESHGPRLK